MKSTTFRSLWLIACVATALDVSAQQRPAQLPQPAQPAQAASPPSPTLQPPPPPQPSLFPGLPTVPLQPLLDRVARESDKQFLVDGRLNPEIFLGGAREEDITYPLLLSILRANGLATVEIEGRVNVVPLPEVRLYATPIVQLDDERIAADEWVTRVLTTANVEAPFLVPILRPLLPQAAHLAAMQPNQLIIVDRYANVRRITAIVRSLDQPGVGRSRD